MTVPEEATARPLHGNKIKRIEPAYTGEMVAVIKGELNTFAVYLQFDQANLDYIIAKVEPWDAYKHINSDGRGIYQVAAQDELGAHSKMRKYIDALRSEAGL